jgi:hypothetical protein
MDTDSVERQVSDRLESAFLFAFGDESPSETGAFADPMKLGMLWERERAEIIECIKLLAREIDSLKAAMP